MVIAVIMAGGKGSRMKSPLEKPLILIKGKPMIDRAIQALKGAEKIDDIMAATTKYTPHTEKYLKEQGIETIKTPAEGYVNDLKFIISKLEVDQVLLTITADLPLIKSSTLDFVLEEYEKCGKPALCVAVPEETFRINNLKPSFEFEGIIPSGLNILRSINKQQDEKILFINKIELALNINSQEDIKFLEEHLDNSGENFR
ncbi:MAG: Adenosylcobinamide-phosphate guanylyltransferase [Methanobacterium sp. PtaU1.Bin242]|nr:MAG: Adenosylcobinamide-phosphate guanylyltransferase [Methanobacterium sp. PtaU1.Bin242]